MADRTLPLCFISYCHDQADFPTIDAFQAEIEKLASGMFHVIRDKSNIASGGTISDHEAELHKSDIVIILCTPQYKEKVIARSPGGANREYGIILERYHTYRQALKTGNPVRPFTLIPILFSGTHSTSILEEISDTLYEDFTKYRTVKNKRGDFEVPDFVHSQHRDVFKKIQSKLASTKSGIAQSFIADYDRLLNLLFLEDKQETGREKYRFNNEEELFDELFVKTRSYNRINDGDKCILIGRKGSGKSTIVDHFHRGNSESYKEPIQIIVDNFDLGLLYNHVFTTPHSSDLRNVMRIESYFEAIWRIYIYTQCIYRLVDEERAGRNVNDLSPHVNGLKVFADARQELRWSQFVEACEKVQANVNEAVETSGSGATYFSELATKLSVPKIVEAVLGKKLLLDLQNCISLCSRKFIFSLDGFDQHFEDFRTSNIAMSADDAEETKRIEFEIAWLRGLLRTVLAYRSSDPVVQDKIAFCITIPQDRYLEVRRTEREDYRLRNLATNLQWSAIELSMLVRKRLEGLSDFISNKDLSPIDRLAQVLESSGTELPSSIEMRVGGNVLSLSFFKYVLRHTFWRPRDMMFYLAAILANKKFVSKHGKVIDHALVKEIIARTTYDVIDTEFIKEFQNSIINLRSILDAFEGARVILSFEDLQEILNSVPFHVSGGLHRIDDTIEKLDLLYQIGFIGVELSGKQLRTPADSRDMFVFSDGIKKFGSIGDDAKRRSNYVIHPIFCEYLTLDSDVGRVVCAYSDEYIERNDVLHE